MTTWTADELTRAGGADELQLASQRPDGTLHRFVTMWVVRAGDNLYVRSAYGPGSGWYRHALASGAGRIRAGGVDRAVTFATDAPDSPEAIDAAYHAKYHRYGARIVDTVVGEHAHGLTVRLVPAPE